MYLAELQEVQQLLLRSAQAARGHEEGVRRRAGIPAQQYHAALQKAQAAAAAAAMQQHKQRPEVAAAVQAAKGAG